jgi:hypothetical protein
VATPRLPSAPAGDAARIREALGHIPADDREPWVRMGMAVKSALGDDGFGLWDEWSRESASYRDHDALAVWRSIRQGGAITLGSLFHEAGKCGFVRHDPASQSNQPVKSAKPSPLQKGDTGDTSPAQHCNSATVAAYAAWKKLPEDFVLSLDLTDIRYHGQSALRIPYRDRAGAETAVRIRRFLNKTPDHDR